MSLVELRAAMKSTLEQRIEPLAKTYTHGGPFGLAELKRYAMQAPCAVLSARSIPLVEYEGGNPVASIQWATYLVAKDAIDAKRDEVVFGLLEAALSVINPTQRWDGQATHMPESISAPNLYSGDLDANGVALWAVVWTQKQDISLVDVSELANFLRYRSTTSLSTDAAVPKAEDAVDLEAPDV